MKYIKIYEDFNKLVKIDISKLSELINPYDSNIWVKVTKPITKEEISNAIRSNNLISPDFPKKTYLIWDESTREEHIARIAWLVTNYDEKYYIEIDFGVPSLGGRFELSDGNHRLAAAIYLNKPYILANVSGDLDLVDEYTYYK